MTTPRTSIEKQGNQAADLQWDRLMSACKSAIETEFGGKLQPKAALPSRSALKLMGISQAGKEGHRIAWSFMNHSGYCIKTPDGNNVVIHTYHKRIGLARS
jgi:hypothetical protein